jgi:hydroxypyruvate isomerase
MLASFRTLIEFLERDGTRDAELMKNKYIEALEARVDFLESSNGQLLEILNEDDTMPTSYMSRQEIALRLARKYRRN